MCWRYANVLFGLRLRLIFSLQIFDKLACSFGQDIFDSLYWMSVTVSQSASQKGKKLPPITHFFVALIYVYIRLAIFTPLNKPWSLLRLHSLILFFQCVTMNVAINSHNNALLTLLVSNQFVELKGSVFKKFEKENLFQISCSGLYWRTIVFTALLILFLL